MTQLFKIQRRTGTGDLAAIRTDVRESSRTLLVLGGLLADQLAADGGRSAAIEQVATAAGWDVVRFNYSAHGASTGTRSAGKFAEVSVSALIEDAITVATYFGDKSLAIIASSVGAGILPFVASRIQGFGTKMLGVCGISAVPPVALRSFVLEQVKRNGLEDDFQRGVSVLIRSDTLPEPIVVHKDQLSDIGRFGARPLVRKEQYGKVSLMRGADDRLSSQEYNRQLVIDLGGETTSVVDLDCGHNIPIESMSPIVALWLERL